MQTAPVSRQLGARGHAGVDVAQDTLPVRRRHNGTHFGVRIAVGGADTQPVGGRLQAWQHRFRGGALICELCRTRRDDLPERSYVVHHSERGLTVRRRAA